MYGIFKVLSLLAVLGLSTGCADLSDDVRRLENRVTSLEERVNILTANFNASVIVLNDLTQTQTGTQAQISQLQADANLAQAQLTELQLETRVTEIIDPCGDSAGYDEVLLRTNDGRVIAYFETGSNRYLSVLIPNVQYATTDGSNCSFKIDVDGNLVY